VPFAGTPRRLIGTAAGKAFENAGDPRTGCLYDVGHGTLLRIPLPTSYALWRGTEVTGITVLSISNKSTVAKNF
jgi:hypothetical protein